MKVQARCGVKGSAAEVGDGQSDALVAMRVAAHDRGQIPVR
jgi:hypothetical protein